MNLIPRVSNIKNMKHILDMTNREKKTFLNSFDSIFSDCDFVLWEHFSKIAGVPEAIKLLENNGKCVRYISNNSVRTFDEYKKRFVGIAVDIKEEQLVHPAVSIIHHLKQIKFKGLIYCIGTDVFKDYLRAAGFELLDGPNEFFGRNAESMIRSVFDEKPVQAVIIDAELDITYSKMIKAEGYLKCGEQDCLFIKGATDKVLKLTSKRSIFGPGYFSEVLEKAVGRKALTFSKPGESLAKHILNRFQIADPSRYLFIGDKLTQDVAFGSQCGFQKLLVLTGGCTKEQLFSDQLPVEQVPDYYADSLADFIKFFDDIQYKSRYL